jgi:hypothetical protein
LFDLYDEFRMLIAALDERQIEYALCGGLAMAVYNHPRATIDIDLLIISQSLSDVRAIAKDLGYNIQGRDMTFAEGVIEIRRVSKIDQQSGQVLSLDLLLVTAEIEQVWNSREEADWETGRLSVVSRDGLILLKRLRSSAQDVADIQQLQEDIDDATN